MAEQIGKTTMPPYLPLKTFTNFLDKLKQGVPTHIDRSYWGNFLSGSTGSVLISSLRFLDLISDEAEPTRELEELAENVNERSRLVGELLRKYYADIFSEVGDLSRATPQKLDRAFTTVFKTKSGSSTHRKAITFFVQAAKYASIPVSPHIINKTRTRTTTARSSTVSRRTAVSTPQLPPAQESTPEMPLVTPPAGDARRFSDTNTKTVMLQSGGEVTLSIQVNWFEVETEERDFLLSLIDDLRKYERRLAETESEDESYDDDGLMEEEENEAVGATSI